MRAAQSHSHVLHSQDMVFVIAFHGDEDVIGAVEDIGTSHGISPTFAAGHRVTRYEIDTFWKKSGNGCRSLDTGYIR